jgi:protein TonB
MTDPPRQQPRFASLLLETYSTRLLTGWLCSLCTLLIAVHLPFAGGIAPVQWSSSRSTQTIPISEVERAEESGEQAPSEDEGAPLPTHQGPPSVDSQSSSSDGSGPDSGNESAKSTEDAKTSSSRAVPVAELAADDNKPEIIGGKGALYLHINYPSEARARGIEGRLKLRFTITRSGDVRRIDVQKSLHPLCDSAAIRGLRSVQFRPAERNDEAIPMRMSLPVRFELKESHTRTLSTKSGPE